MKLICLEYGNENLILFYFRMTVCFAMTVLYVVKRTFSVKLNFYYKANTPKLPQIYSLSKINKNDYLIRPIMVSTIG